MVAYESILVGLEALFAYGHEPRACGIRDADIDEECLEDVELGQPLEMQDRHYRQSTPPSSSGTWGNVLAVK